MKKSILIMDQDLQFLSLYKHILPADKFYVLKCRNLESILSFVRNIKIDVIICDADKPLGCGVDLLKIMKAEHSKIPVIIVSGAFYPSNLIISDEAYAFLPKIQIMETLPKLIADDSEIWKALDTVKTT